MMHAILAVCLSALSTFALAQTPPTEPDHAAHHPPGASAPAPVSRAPADKSPKSTPSDATMNSMQKMHAKMAAAKTAEERQALMADHMKTMQDGMATMGRMKGDRGGMSSGTDAMSKRMDMMEMMMQMMMDREAARAPAAK